jgi:N-formylglutamate amidohydrolase
MSNQEQDHYFRLIRPEKQTLPVVVDVPHAGEWIPDEVLDEMVVHNRTLKRDLDLYVDRLWAQAPELGATLIASNVSRYVIDLNRADDDISPETVVGGVRVNQPGYYQDRGVVWRTTTDGTPVMRQPMTREAFDRRIATFHTPYHGAIAEEIARVKAQFGYCILIDGHSMPSRGRSGHTDPGTRRADIVPGDVEGSSCSELLTDLVSAHFREQGYSVRPNTPYKGGWITRSFGAPDQDVHALQIEVNRELYMDERTFVIKERGLMDLASACCALLPKLSGLLEQT